MPSLAHSTSISRTKLFDKVQVFRPKIQVVLDANLQLRRLVVLAAVGRSQIGSLGSGRRFRGAGLQCEPLDVLPLHGAGKERVCHLESLSVELRFADLV